MANQLMDALKVFRFFFLEESNSLFQINYEALEAL